MGGTSAREGQLWSPFEIAFCWRRHEFFVAEDGMQSWRSLSPNPELA
jgi:hypothetical protein